MRALARLASLLALVGSLSFSTTGAQSKAGPEQPPPISPEEGRKQARVLVDNLLNLKPQENVTQNLLFQITDSSARELTVPARLQVIAGSNDFSNVYETTGGAAMTAMQLTIRHIGGKPNQYLVSQPPGSKPRELQPPDLYLPFAGSDFWPVDLGLDFLHWPQQRIVKRQMRRSVFCDVLQSINPQPPPGGYSKVESWIGANRPGELVIVHADAYDGKGGLLKVFEPRKLQRVNGVRQLEEMDIRNRQTGSSTKVEFQFKESN